MSPSDPSRRIALLNPSFWPEVRRGSERMVHDLALDLAAAGHRPSIITSQPGRPRRDSVSGVELVRSWRPSPYVLDRRGFQEHLTHLPFSFAALCRRRPDVAHAFFPSDAMAAGAWARSSHRPTVFSYMGVPRRDQLSSRRWRKRALEQAVLGSDAVVALSAAARDAVWRWFAVEPRLIYPGVRLEDFSLGTRRTEDPTIVCGADTADSRKRADLLARAHALVRRSHPTARLRLARCGDRALERRLSSLAGGVEFHDLESSQMPSIFQTAWVSVLPSYNEAFGLVLVESLACGTPVVGARDGGVPEIVDRDEIGRLFDGDDEAALARAIVEALELAHDPGTRERCRERAAAFTTQATAAGHESLYAELLETRGA